MSCDNFSVIKAKHSHTEGICNVLTKSIKELCYADHKNDPKKLTAWLKNKTPENIRRWIDDPSCTFLVTITKKESIVIGASIITVTGMILLHYVHPNYIGRGVGTSMLDTIEKFSRKSGLKIIMASSTISALSFYEKHGFKAKKLPSKKNEGIQLIKTLTF